MISTHRINKEIRARQVRLVVDGSDPVVMPLGEALGLAQADGLDLVEVAPNAAPPVVKILDYSKMRYEEQKRAKKSPKIESKTVKFGLRISEADKVRLLGSCEKFLEKGNRVTIVVEMKGRERGRPERAREFMKELLSSLGASPSVSESPQRLSAVLTK